MSATATARTGPRPGRVLRWLLRMPALMYRLGFADRLGPRLLLLSTTGRRTGRRRTCGLNYVTDGTTLYVLSGFGRSGWYRNLRADPHVVVQVGRQVWHGIARAVVDPDERAHARLLLRDVAPRQGPPRLLSPVFRLIGLDYDAEVRRLDDPDLDLPTVAIRPVVVRCTPAGRGSSPGAGDGAGLAGRPPDVAAPTSATSRSPDRSRLKRSRADGIVR